MTGEQYIDIAIDIFKKTKYPYGAIVVKDDKIIGRSDDKTLIEICSPAWYKEQCKLFNEPQDK